MPSQNNRSTRRPCVFDGCGRPRSADGLCWSHTRQAAAGGPLRPIRAYGRPGCSHDGCQGKHHGQGLCSAHLGQLTRDGATSDIVNRSGASEVVLLSEHAEIIITNRQGREVARATINLDDVAMVERHRWVLTQVARANYIKGYPAGRREAGLVYLHRHLVRPKSNEVVDHWDGDGLNNRRENMRAVSRRLNHQNQVLQPRNKSGHRGVSWSKSKKQWSAQVGHMGRMIPLGHFDDLEEAARVAREARERLFENFQTREP